MKPQKANSFTYHPVPLNWSKIPFDYSFIRRVWCRTFKVASCEYLAKNKLVMTHYPSYLIREAQEILKFSFSEN